MTNPHAPFTAYFINPFSKSINRQTWDGTLQDLYGLLGCNMVQPVYLKNGEVIYVDEEGLFEGTQRLWKHADYPSVLINYGLYVGPPDQNGWDTPPKAPIFELFTKVYFANKFGSFERAHYEPEEV